MCKRMKFRSFMLICNAALLIILCMAIGYAYMPVMAKEGDADSQSALEGEAGTALEPLPEDMPDIDLKDDGKIEENLPHDEEELISDDEIGNIDEEEKEVSEKETENEAEKECETVTKQDGEAKQDIPEIVNVVVPVTYVLALNPYGLPISIGEDEIITEQVISGTYGIVNKSSLDQIVKISLIVEDMNDGELVFVDSAEEAWNAEEGIYAVYLAAVPANGEEILVDGAPADENVTGESLQHVKMTGANEKAVALYDGMNQIAFKLSGAEYSLESNKERNNEEKELDDDNADDTLEETSERILKGLASDGSGVTAYTFSGAMNPNAAWEKLSGGIKLSVVYTYQMTDGSEEIIEGTGAMVSID